MAPKTRKNASSITNVVVFETRNPDNKPPQRQFPNDAGYDLYAEHGTCITVRAQSYSRIPTGLRMKFPSGWFGQIVGRSGMMNRDKLMVITGTVDSGYTGRVDVMVMNMGDKSITISGEMRIAQLLVLPVYRPGVFKGKACPKMSLVGFKVSAESDDDDEMTDRYLTEMATTYMPIGSARGARGFGSTDEIHHNVAN